MADFKWVLDEGKFLDWDDVKRLMGVCRKRKKEAERNGNKVAVRDYFIIDFAVSTGLRVAELCDLKCEDILLQDKMSCLIVKNGKCGKRRTVRFSADLREDCIEYLKWKQTVGESIDRDAPIFCSSNTRGHMSRRALQKAFKRCARRAGLNSRYSIHSLRHTYACHLYKASGYNLRLVQKQLGHSSIKITEAYANVLDPDLDRALEKLYKA